MTALGLLPAVCLLVWACVLKSQRARAAADGWLDAASDSITLGVIWLVLGTELLGLLRGLSRGPLLLWWGLPALVGIWRLLASGSRPQLFAAKPMRLPPAALLLLVPLAWSGLQAILSAPNTGDCLSYHLPRQLYWAQQRHVGHYATSVLRQLVMPPLAEYAGLHTLILSGGDRLHNLLQWSALVGVLAVISGIVRDLGGGPGTRLLAMCFFACAPPAFAEASSSKNDLVVSFWLVLATRELIRLARGRDDARRPWRLGVQLGALALTKGTGLIFGLPLLLGTLVVLRRARAMIPGLGVLVFCATAMNLPYLARNRASFGAPWGPADVHNERVTSELHTVEAAASTVLRNVLAHLALPWPEWNAALERVVVTAHRALGLSPDDPRTTYRLPPYAPPRFLAPGEDTATAPLQVLFAIGFPLLLGMRRRGRRLLWLLWGASVAGFLLFSLLLKWQLWHVRLVTPLIALLAPAFGLALDGTPRWVRGGALAALLAGLLPWLNLEERPLLGPASLLINSRESSLYNSLGARAAPLQAIIEACARLRPHTVGLMTGWSSLEYVYQSSLRLRLGDVRFEQFNPRFRPPGAVASAPDVVLVESNTGAHWLEAGRLRQEATGAIYVVMASGPGLALCLRDPGPAVVTQADLVVLGSIGSCEPWASEPLTRCRLRITQVLAGTAGSADVELLAVDATRVPAGRVLEPAVLAPGLGIWALRRVGSGEYVLPSPVFWRPVSELERVRALLGQAGR